MLQTDQQSGASFQVLMDLFSMIGQVVWTVARACWKNILFFLPRAYKDITNDVILITGGGRGVGRLLAVEFAKRQPKHIIIWGQHEDTLSATVRAVELKGVACTYMICDVGCHDQVVAKAEEVRKVFGGVDILVNNAGMVNGGSISEVTPAEFQRTINVNLMAHFWTVKEFLPRMTERNHGHVVSINSMLGLMGLGGASDYCASKFGVHGFHESLQMELARDGLDGVKVTTIHPYLINTDMFEGVQARFPSLLPALDKNYVAWKIVNAVCVNQYFCIMPRMMYFFFFLKCILPMETILAMQKFLNLDKAMNTWQGKQTKKAQ